MKTALKIIKYGAISIYALCGVLLLVFLVPKTGWKALNVATGSMTPAIPAGSLVIIHHTPLSHIKTGDVVTYINPYNTKETITHRVVEVTKNGNIPAYVTKGDANQTADRQILGGNIVGKVQVHVPKVGRVLAWARKPIGLIILVLIPGLLIIIEEIRQLVKPLAEQERAKVPSPTAAAPATAAVTATIQKPIAKAPPKPKPKHRGFDGIARAFLVVGLIVAVAGGATRASLSSSASLTHNTISTATVAPSDHIVIQRVFIGGGTGGSVCPQINSSASIVSTGPNSINHIIQISNCHVTIDNSSTVNVTNYNNQSSQTGTVTNSNNTSGGNATSGDANNSNSTTTTINIDNSGANIGGQWILLYNPTAKSVSIKNWTISDNSGVAQTLPNRTIPAHWYLLIRSNALSGQKIGDGLSGASDRLVMKNTLGSIVDSLSWGSDTTILNPAVPVIPDGGSALRKTLGVDTDSASDWIVQIP